MSGSNSSAHADKTRAEPLSFTVHGVAVPAADGDAQRTRLGRLKMLAVLLVCAAPVVASYLTYFVVRPAGRANQGALIQPARPMPSLPLRTLDGLAVEATSLKGQWLLVVVAPSACDAGCEKQLYLQRQLREMLGRERDRLDKVWLITDGSAVAPALRQALEVTPAMQLLRVDASVLSRWLEPEAGRQLADHLYLIDPQGDWMMRMPPGAEPARLKRDLDRLLRASASWDRPGR